MSTILVIEDELELREEICDLLGFEGYDVLNAPNGKTGVESATTYEPDLIVSDIAMPQMNGYEVLMALRNIPNTMNIPFIFLTAKADRSFVRHGMELGADDYLTKPFTNSELLSAIETRLAKQNYQQAEIDSTLENAKQNLVRLVTHEMRTPLISVNMMQEIIDRQLDTLSKDELRELIAIQRDGHHRLTHLVEQMVIYTEFDTGHINGESIEGRLRQIRVADLVNVSINQGRNFALKAAFHPVHIHHSDEDVTIMGDLRLLKHGLAEIIANALDFSPPDRPVEIDYYVEEDSVYINIVDYGPGINPAQVSKLMADFTQGDRQKTEKQGLGLGLSLAQRIADVHDGMLLVHASEKPPTKITVKLPVDF